MKNDVIYLRFHGREHWYSYKYSKKELKEVFENATAKKPKRLVAFFNNDHDMLKNATLFMSLARLKV